MVILAKVLPQNVERLGGLADSHDIASVLVIDTVLRLVVAPIPLERAVRAVALKICIFVRVTAAAAALEHSKYELLEIAQGCLLIVSNDRVQALDAVKANEGVTRVVERLHRLLEQQPVIFVHLPLVRVLVLVLRGDDAPAAASILH